MQTICSILGDFYHQHDPAYETVKKAAAQLGVAFNDYPLDDMADVLSQNPSAIIFMTENRLNPQSETVDVWLTPALDEKITQYVAQGGSLIAMHAALASYPADSAYASMLKGHFISHPPDHYDVHYQSNAAMPFLDAAPFDFTALDEHYVVYVDTENTNVFMTLSSPYGEGPAGWYHTYGNGKVIVLTPTHNKEGFAHPEMIRLVAEAIRWAI